MNNDPGSIIEPKSVTVDGTTPETLKDVQERFRNNKAEFAFGLSLEEAQAAKNPYLQYVDAAGFRPNEVPVLKLQAVSGDIILPAGFYLLSAGTGGGKSITAAALVLTALAQKSLARYCYCNEARTPTNKESGNPFAFDNVAVEQVPDEMEKWPTHLEKYLQGLDKASTPPLIIIDSIALPLRSYRSTKRAGMSTMKEGMQPMDIEFVVQCEDIAVRNGCIVIGIVNNELVPFSDKLEGMSEGLINVSMAGRFQMRNRFDRAWHDITLSRDAVDAGATFLRYQSWKEETNVIFGLTTA